MPGRGERLAPDDRLAEPEAGEEYIDGRRLEYLAADAEHADPQCDLSYVGRACVAKGWVASTELLTRTDVGSDFATVPQSRRRPRDASRSAVAEIEVAAEYPKEDDNYKGENPRGV